MIDMGDNAKISDVRCVHVQLSIRAEYGRKGGAERQFCGPYPPEGHACHAVRQNREQGRRLLRVKRNGASTPRVNRLDAETTAWTFGRTIFHFRLKPFAMLM
jgi:hypothetical protein